MKNFFIIFVLFLLAIAINSCGESSSIVIGNTYFLYDETSPEVQCPECLNWWFIKIIDDHNAKLFSAKSATGFPACASQVEYSYDSESEVFRILTVPNENISDDCKAKFFGKWKWEGDKLAKELEKPALSQKVNVKKNNPKLTKSISISLNKIKSTWPYQLDNLNNEKLINDSGLTEFRNENVCVNYIVLENCMIASYRTNNASDFGTQIITFNNFSNILENSPSTFFVEDVDIGKRKLLISREGYDKDGHWWQKGTYNLISNEVKFATEKEH